MSDFSFGILMHLIMAVVLIRYIYLESSDWWSLALMVVVVCVLRLRLTTCCLGMDYLCDLNFESYRLEGDGFVD